MSGHQPGIPVTFGNYKELRETLLPPGFSQGNKISQHLL
jgi:hypothetical protein